MTHTDYYVAPLSSSPPPPPPSILIPAPEPPFNRLRRDHAACPPPSHRVDGDDVAAADRLDRGRAVGLDEGEREPKNLPLVHARVRASARLSAWGPYGYTVARQGGEGSHLISRETHETCILLIKFICKSHSRYKITYLIA